MVVGKKNVFNKSAINVFESLVIFIYLKRITSLLKRICYHSIKSIATWEIIPVFIKYLWKLILDIIFVVNVSNFKEVLCVQLISF